MTRVRLAASDHVGFQGQCFIWGHADLGEWYIVMSRHKTLPRAMSGSIVVLLQLWSVVMSMAYASTEVTGNMLC